VLGVVRAKKSAGGGCRRDGGKWKSTLTLRVLPFPSLHTQS